MKKQSWANMSILAFSSLLLIGALAFGDGPGPSPSPSPSPSVSPSPSPSPSDLSSEAGIAGVAVVDEADVVKDDIEDPNALPLGKQLYCINHILNVVNKNFHSHFLRSEIYGFEFRETKREYLGFKRGGAYNIHIVATHVSPEVANSVHPGRYTSLKNILQLGIGASLHVEDDFDGFQHTFIRKENGDGTYTLHFFAHIDSAYAYFVPTGTLAHFLIDVVGSKTRNPCPGHDEQASEAAQAEFGNYEESLN